MDILLGIKDATYNHQICLLWQSIQIRFWMTKIITLNGISLASNFLFERLVFPLLIYLVDEQSIFFIRILQIFWIIPFQAILCSLLNIYYWQQIAQTLPNPSLPLTIQETIYRSINNGFFRLLLLPGLFLQDYAFGCVHMIPVILHRALLYSFYAFEYQWNKLGCTLKEQLLFFETHWLYFLGFGLPFSLLMQWIPSLYMPSFFAMFLPVFVVCTQNIKILPSSRWRFPIFMFVKIIPYCFIFFCKRKMKK